MNDLLDLSRLTFDEFIGFFFDHDMETEEYWYLSADLLGFNDFDDDGVASPPVIVGHLTRLFRQFGDVAAEFSPEQINAGIWAMFSYGPFRLQKHLWLPSAPFEARLECIHSMYFVYSDYVATSSHPVMHNCFDMYWDCIPSGFWEHLSAVCKVAEGDVASLNVEQKTLLDALFATLCKILSLPDQRTQGYALHGLGHMHHPGVKEVVQEYLDQHRGELPAEGIRWVEACRDGKVM